LTFVLALMMGSFAQGITRAEQDEKNTVSAAAPQLHRVTLTADGETRDLLTASVTVGELLKEHHVVLGKSDRCSVKPNVAVTDAQEITIIRVRSEVVTDTNPIPFPRRKSYSTSLPVGETVVKREGVPGSHAITYRDYYRDEIRTTRVKLAAKTVAPRPQVEVIGTRGMTLASRHLVGGRRMLSMVATGYGPNGNGKWGARTASGRLPGYGVVAIDPRIIPMGTRLYVEGYGPCIAGDTGGAIKGHRIDLGFNSNHEARNVGRRRVRVVILN
jgi:3D (Asp-Asp-Asp) domain-containing protein